MDDSKRQYSSIDDYISTFSGGVRDILEKLRQTIRQAAPEAQEAISYQMPTFKLHGNLVHFAAFKHHIGLYPTPSAVEEFGSELAPYVVAKGSIRFPLDEPIPYDLVRKIVEYRVKETVQKQKAKKTAGK
jgi:uncharacterized protein YdhG (YjbR/CyaY superfamily)